ncbi:hypothetical protein EC957_005755 [Mortierella hygrophila]|uniref:Uncharacterized protein n=1 Tax=Mortierella hygrophila TaxID=979708 RepID=A0A9P6JZ01_9FUNG|nr:hypothetical protein EC957_005755 [Mortierella hygrophila]
MTAPPSYAGTIAVLPVDVIALTYFKITKISKWGLEGFLTSTGLTELEFMSSLKDISRIKRLPSDIRIFAKRLNDYYGGIFQDEVTEIAKNNARKNLNRQLLSGKEHLLVQSKVNETIERDKNSLSDPFATSSPFTWGFSSRSTGKRTAARTPQNSSKKRSGITKARDEYVSLEEGLGSDEHDDTSDEAVVGGLKVAKSIRAGNEGKTVASDNDNGDDRDDDEDDEDGESEETVEDLIQELQSLEEESEPGFHPLIRALYHAARGEQFKKPQHKPQLGVCQSLLYEYVWNRLDTFFELPTVEKKDVFVAISGIVDLDVHKDFPQHADLLSECRAAIELQYPKIRDHLQTYRQFVDDDDGLMEAKLGELMKQLKKDMSRFEDDSDEMVAIEILRIL